ncbi:uncharacterized protein EV420DRAFT_1482032 [Desarmillaria tabescens]|uniref:DUF6533 domain-containing protein n=1 Tax=Armillaria tabescens TaxID=1929756 RepID=A0AA39K181_ARMTA|nr:uncharacterized protein EV420DRAFT_1482032 [Desarmillaria tabescens]KAK0452722.1 hypothetical protein EV420DRAFT_1482032 [Desarmillaria tabescens]
MDLDISIRGVVHCISDQSAAITWSLISWDYLITIDDEVTLFWFSRRSWIKFLFFTTKYLEIKCGKVTLQLLVIESILILRIWAMMGKQQCTSYGFSLACSPAAQYRLQYMRLLSSSLQHVMESGNQEV